MSIGKTSVSLNGGKGIPEFTYSGTYVFNDEGNDNWNLELKSSGDLVFTKLNNAKELDVFCVGGGGGGGGRKHQAYEGAAGAGGYTNMRGGIKTKRNTSYPIVVGAGGTGGTGGWSGNNGGGSGTRGGISSAFGVYSAGGGPGGDTTGGTGGSGGARPGEAGCKGGTDGGNASGGGTGTNGLGCGTSTRKFFYLDLDSNATAYCNGGNAGYQNNTAGAANTGNGGGAGYSTSAAHGKVGGSGIVIIRNHRAVEKSLNLYSYGNTYDNVTGGWTAANINSGSTVNGSVTWNTSDVQITTPANSTWGIITNNALDLTKYHYLNIVFYKAASGASGNYGMYAATTLPNTSWAASKTYNSAYTVAGSSQYMVMSMDIRSLSGLYQIGIMGIVGGLFLVEATLV